MAIVNSYKFGAFTTNLHSEVTLGVNDYRYKYAIKSRIISDPAFYD